MKILCLHGAGLNASLMEKQLGAITAGLDSSYEFVFVDGDIERPAAPGVPDYVHGPFFCFYDQLEGDYIRAACDLVDLVVEEEGPFDGFVGFSQGAAVGISYMLDLAINRPEQDCPFRWALLFSSVIAFSPDPTFLDFEFALFDAQIELEKASGQLSRVTDEPRSIEETSRPGITLAESKAEMLSCSTTRKAFQAEYTAVLKDFCAFAETLGWNHDRSSGKFDAITSRIADEELLAGKFIPRVYHPGLTSERLNIPTVLCTGRCEPPEVLRQSKVVGKLFREGSLVHLEHNDGHNVPRDLPSLQMIISATKKAIERSRWTVPRAVL